MMRENIIPHQLALLIIQPYVNYMPRESEPDLNPEPALESRVIKDVVVEYKPLDELTTNANFTEVDRDISKFTVEPGATQTTDLEVVTMPSDMTGAKVELLLREHGYEPANIAELIAAIKQDPSLGIDRIVVALKDHCVGRKDRMDSTPMVAPHEGGRALGTARTARVQSAQNFEYLARRLKSLA